MSRLHKRRRKLIKPGLQLKMSALFLGLTTLMLLLQFALLSTALHHSANSLPSDGPELLSQTNGIAWNLVFTSAAVFLPLTLMVGVLATFRVAGPIYRFETFLRAVKRGENPGSFTLRKGDELQELAALINDVTIPLRQAPARPDTTPDSSEEASSESVRTAA